MKRIRLGKLQSFDKMNLLNCSKQGRGDNFI